MSALDSLIASALEHAAHSVPIVDALAAGWEARHGVDVDTAETIAIMQVRRLNARRAAGERASGMLRMCGRVGLTVLVDGPEAHP